MPDAFAVLPRVSVVRPVPRQPAPQSQPATFAHNLTQRLRRLERDTEPRPRFVTTVTTGRFLDPPPNKAALLGLCRKKLFEYSSKPAALPARPRDPPPQHRCENLLAATRALAAGVAGLSIPNYADTNKRGNVAPQYGNMMYEKRVVRGPTFASHPLAAGDAAVDASGASRAAESRRRALARRAAARRRGRTPPPAPGRFHHPVQTEHYLEELFDHGGEQCIGVQTDQFLDRPPTPRYMPAKTGADAYTQIYPGDLFDFDVEVQPIIEVLVGKTTEAALSEAAQEEELATLREQARRFRELRDAERAERARLAAQDQRLNDEKERRVWEARAGLAAARGARARVAAAALVRGYVGELLPSVLAGLRRAGFLEDTRATAVQDEVLPWLASEVAAELEALLTSRDLVTEMVREVVETRASLYAEAGMRADAEAANPPPDSPSVLSVMAEDETEPEMY